MGWGMMLWVFERAEREVGWREKLGGDEVVE